MAAPWNPPVKGEEFQFVITLEDANVPGSFKASATLASGDFMISKDGGAFAQLSTLPTVTPAGGVGIAVTLSATEMNADKILVTAIDQTAPKEWTDAAFCILTTQ